MAFDMIDIYEHNDDGYKALVEFGGWRVAILKYNERFSAVTELERHTETDEVFVLLEGGAVLFASTDEGETEKQEMVPAKLYNVPKNTWHHIVVTKDARVLIVENSDTNTENTEKKFL